METKEETEIWLIEVGYCIIILQILFFVVLFVFISIYLFLILSSYNVLYLLLWLPHSSLG
jgi:Zn-dependent protease with chaperone function